MHTLTLLYYGMIAFICNFAATWTILRLFRFKSFLIWGTRLVVVLVSGVVYFRVLQKSEYAPIKHVCLVSLIVYALTWFRWFLGWLLYCPRKNKKVLIHRVWRWMLNSFILHGIAVLSAVIIDVLFSKGALPHMPALDSPMKIFAIVVFIISVLGLTLSVLSVLIFVFGEKNKSGNLGYAFVFILGFGLETFMLSIGSGYYLLNMPGGIIIFGVFISIVLITSLYIYFKIN